MVAIFVPLTALLAVLVVLWPAARRRVGGASLFLAAGTLIAIPVTTSAGEWMRHRVMNSEILDRHAALGTQLVFWFALLTIAMVLWWALHTPLFESETGTLSPTVRRTAVAIAGAGTILLAVISTWSVVRIGHSGAEAVWGGMTCCKMMGMVRC